MSENKGMFTLLGVTLPLNEARIQYIMYAMQSAEAAWMGVENQSDVRAELKAQVHDGFRSIEFMSLFYDNGVREAIRAGEMVTLVMTNDSGLTWERSYDLASFGYLDFGTLWEEVSRFWMYGYSQNVSAEVKVGTAQLMRLRYNVEVHEVLGMSM